MRVIRIHENVPNVGIVCFFISKGTSAGKSCVIFSCTFVTFLCGVLGQVWYLIVLIPDICLLPYFRLKERLRSQRAANPYLYEKTLSELDKIEKSLLNSVASLSCAFMRTWKGF